MRVLIRSLSKFLLALFTFIPRFQDNRHMKLVRLSARRTGRLYPLGNISGTYLCWRLSRPQDHSAAGMIMLMINPSDTNGNRTLDLPVCGTVPQTTAPQRAPAQSGISVFITNCTRMNISQLESVKCLINNH
jgi:hypothetical protein